jgi:lipopolysaccharide export system permease protein
VSTLARYLGKEVTGATLLVLLALLALFALLDLVRELGIVGFGSYQMSRVLLFVALSVPGHVYDLLPLAVLIGAIVALTQLALHSEYTVMRVSGASVLQIAAATSLVSALFALTTFLFGEFVVPASERMAQQLRLRALSGVVAQQFRSGLWVKDEGSFINVQQVLADATLLGVRIFEFDKDFRLRSMSHAARGTYQGPDSWQLEDVRQTRFEDGRAVAATLPGMEWRSVLNPDILGVLLVDPQQMSATHLWSYVQHLRENRQKASRYEIAFWSKFIYPLAVMVMMVLALPFAALQRRAGGVGGRIIAGIMLGLSFHLLSRLFAHAGQINDWPPLFAAAFPTLAFLGIAAGMLWWVERR